ncbi:MAG: aldo/keto reductase [Chloroflexi bacterium]|nr:aldo/keto reductase [Chloroflexota bacterium]
MSRQPHSPNLTLSNGLVVPQLGLGTWNLGRATVDAVGHALERGYRHIDTADIYETHGSIGQAMAQSGVQRAEIFIVSKLWSHSVAAELVAPAVDRFLKELGTDHLDLLLIHWPARSVPASDTLTAMDKVRQAGKIKSIGVSNFGIEQMKEALASGVPVVNNQIEYNLNHHPEDVLDYCLANDITVTAYSPLERGNRQQEALVAEQATKYEATREQVLINWLLAKGMIVIPRSAKPAHIDSNWASLGWTMEAEDVKRLDAAH